MTLYRFASSGDRNLLSSRYFLTFPSSISGHWTSSLHHPLKLSTVPGFNSQNSFLCCAVSPDSASRGLKFSSAGPLVEMPNFRHRRFVFAFFPFFSLTLCCRQRLSRSFFFSLAISLYVCGTYVKNDKKHGTRSQKTYVIKYASFIEEMNENKI